MKLVTWNIQWGKGCDGVVDLARIVRTAMALADADVFCFQEVSCNFAKLDGGVDQSAELAALLPGYHAVFGAAVEAIDTDGRAHRFGNMTFSRLPVLQTANHLLPFPRQDRVRSMRRAALEVTVQTPLGPLRVTNTHLEYHSAAQRDAQVGRLLDLQQEASEVPADPEKVGLDPYTSQTITASGVLCGDFNFDVADPLHPLISRSGRPGVCYRDAWSAAHPGAPRAPTCGIYDRVQWPKGPDCRDFIFVTEDLVDRILGVAVDGVSGASDHQPIVLIVAS